MRPKLTRLKPTNIIIIPLTYIEKNPLPKPMAYPPSKKYLFLLALLIIGVISGCSSKLNLQPQIDEVNSISHQNTYPNEGKTLWAVGQWALYRADYATREEVFRLFDSKPVGGFRKISITGQSGTSFWVEQQIVWPDHEEHIAALVTAMNQTDAKHLKITRLKFTRSGGEVVLNRDSADPPGGGNRRRGDRDRGEVQGGGAEVLGAQFAACVCHAFV